MPPLASVHYALSVHTLCAISLFPKVSADITLRLIRSNRQYPGPVSLSPIGIGTLILLGILFIYLSEQLLTPVSFSLNPEGPGVALPHWSMLRGDL